MEGRLGATAPQADKGEISADTSRNQLRVSIECGLETCPTLWDSAAGLGKLQLLYIAVERDCKFNTDVSWRAAGGGHLEVIKWCYDGDFRWHPELFSAAATGGYTDIMEWVLDDGGMFDEDTCRAAAKAGRLNALQWLLYSHQCPLDAVQELPARVTLRFCNGRGLKAVRGIPKPAPRPQAEATVLQWLKANACPWNTKTCAKVPLQKDVSQYHSMRSNK